MISYTAGADDKDIDLFESQYIVPNGISYNSYLIKDEKVTIMDTIDKRKTEEWIKNIENALNRRKTILPSNFTLRTRSCI